MFQAAAPACTELETIVLDWLGKMINLPDDFLSCKKGSKGGGVIQVSRKDQVQINKGKICPSFHRAELGKYFIRFLDDYNQYFAFEIY